MSASGTCWSPETHNHAMPFEVVPHLIDYNPLERRRVKRLGLEPRFARTQDSTRMMHVPPPRASGLVPCQRYRILPQEWTNLYEMRNKVQCRNSLAPFSSMQKVYWSPFFRENMDHKLKTSLWLRPYQEWECGPPMTQPLFKVPSSCRQKSLL